MFSKTALMAGTIMMAVAVSAPVYAGSDDANDQAGATATENSVRADDGQTGDEIAAQYEKAKEFTYKQKDEFLAWVKEKSDQLGQQYDDVSAQVKQDSSEAVEDLSSAWDNATNKLNDAFADAKDATAETWEDMKANTLRALEDAQKTLSGDEGTE